MYFFSLLYFFLHFCNPLKCLNFAFDYCTNYAIFFVCLFFVTNVSIGVYALIYEWFIFVCIVLFPI